MNSRLRVFSLFAFLVGGACAVFVAARMWQALRSSNTNDATAALVIIVPITIASVLLLVRWRPPLRVASVIVPATILALCTLVATAFGYQSFNVQKWASSSWIAFAAAVICSGVYGSLSIAATSLVFHGSRRVISGLTACKQNI